MGAAAARNTGVREACGALVAFLDSDDVWLPEKLARHVPFHCQSGAAATCTSFEMLRENGHRSVRHLDEKTDWTKAFLHGCHVGPGSTLIADRAVFDRIGYLDEKLKRLEDWDWLLRLVRTERFSVLDEVLSEVRVSGYPPYAPVAKAIHGLVERHKMYLHTQPDNWNTFRTGCEIESAYISLHNKYVVGVLIHLFRAFIFSPKAFFRAIRRILRGRMSNGV